MSNDSTRDGGFAHVANDLPDILGMIVYLYENEDERYNSLPYQEYLQTEWWQDLRRRKVRASGFRCELCQASNRKLDVHHRNYDRVGCERWEDLIVLCRPCHQREHGIGGPA